MIRRLPGPLQQPATAELHRQLYTAVPPLDPTLHAELTALYRDDILRTQELIGRDLSHWLP